MQIQLRLVAMGSLGCDNATDSRTKVFDVSNAGSTRGLHVHYKCRNQLVQKVSREAHEKSLCIDTLVRRDF